jgi:Tol biopolymer transport system component
VLAKAPITAKIVFASGRDGNREIYLMNPDGTQQVNISRDKADDVSPIWSPTGEQILFASDRDRFLGSWDLYLMDPDGKNVRSVFEKSADRGSPTWSPDGKQIAYSRFERGEWFLYIGTINEGTEEQVAIGGIPTWSPNGTEIAYIGGAVDKPRRISLLNVQTKKQSFFPFPKIPTWVRYPQWSPRGDKLAFSWLNRAELRREDFQRETIYIVNRNGTGLQQVIDEAGPAAVDPVWSPNGEELLYVQADDVDAELPIRQQVFKIALNGGALIQLTHVGLGHHLGSWFDPAFSLPVSPQSQLLTTTWGDVKKKNDQ